MSKRLAEAPAAEVREHVFGTRLADEFVATFPYMSAINKAHVVMMAERGMVAPDVAAKLLTAIAKVEEDGVTGLTPDSSLEDAYFNYEAAIIRRAGPEVGGQLHTGRSRNDLNATVVRMRLRDGISDFLAILLMGRRTLLDRAARYASAVMTGHTHLQPAQPTTFGHYLLGVAMALERDSQRIAASYHTTNQSPLGAAAFAGTAFPVDRHLTAQLLGFDGLVQHSLDAVASRDFVLEFLSALAIWGMTVSRFAQDLHVWFAPEFGAIDLPDSVAGTSSIMPQKKNPIVLEHLKGKAARFLAAFVAAATAVKGTHFTNTFDANRESASVLWEVLPQATGCAILLDVVAGTVSPKSEVIAARASEDFSTATELADTLVRESGFAFRQAHAIVGMVVRTAVQQGRLANQITLQEIDEAARATTGRSSGLSNDAIIRAMDPWQSVQTKVSIGGPSPEEVSRMVGDALKRLEHGELELQDRLQRLNAARELLQARVHVFQHAT